MPLYKRKWNCAICDKPVIWDSDKKTLSSNASQTDYSRCHECWIWKTLNTPCDFCSKQGGVVPFVNKTAEGLKRFMVCPKCMEKLT